MHRFSGPDREDATSECKIAVKIAPTKARRQTRGSGLDRERGGIGVKDRGQDRSYKHGAKPVRAVSTAKGAALERKIAVKTAPTKAGRTRGSGLDRERGGSGVKDRGQDCSYKGAGAEPWERSRPRRGRHWSKRSRSRPLPHWAEPLPQRQDCSHKAGRTCQNKKYRCAIGNTSAGSHHSSWPSARTW